MLPVSGVLAARERGNTLADHEMTAGTAGPARSRGDEWFGYPDGKVPLAQPEPEPVAFTFARQETLQEIHDDVNRVRATLRVRRLPLGVWRTVLAVWLGVTLAGITLAALAFLAVATFASAAVDDVQSDVGSAEPFELPTDFPTDFPLETP